MTDRALLESKIRDAGYRTDYVTKMLGITYQAWLNKIKGISEFKQSEIVKLAKLLKLSQKEIRIIFFSLEGDSKSL